MNIYFSLFHFINSLHFYLSKYPKKKLQIFFIYHYKIAKGHYKVSLFENWILFELNQPLKLVDCVKKKLPCSVHCVYNTYISTTYNRCIVSYCHEQNLLFVRLLLPSALIQLVFSVSFYLSSGMRMATLYFSICQSL